MAKQQMPLRRVRRAGWLGWLLLVLLAGAALGWHLWWLDSARIQNTSLTFEQMVIDGALIGAAVILGGLILRGLVVRASRRARRALDQVSTQIETDPTGVPQLQKNDDPAVQTVVTHLASLQQQVADLQQQLSASKTTDLPKPAPPNPSTKLLRHVLTSLELEPLLTQFVDALARTFELTLAAVGLLDANGIRVRHGVVRQEDGALEGLTPLWLPLTTGIAGEAAQSRQAVIRRAPPFDTSLRAPGAVRTQMALPLLESGQLVGMLLAQLDHSVSDDVVTQIQEVSELLATALTNAQQYGAARERATSLMAINELARTISSSLEIERILGTALQQIRQLVPYDQASVTIFNTDQNYFEVQAANDVFQGSLERGQVFDAVGTPLRTAFEAGHPVYLAELDDRTLLESLPPLDPAMHSLLILPLAAGEVRLGTVNLASRTANAFNDSHISLLGGLSHFLTTALINGRLYQQRAQALQQVEATQNHLLLVEKLRALGELAGGVTHDFNNLLAGIIGNVQVLMLEIQEPEQLQTLRLIEKAAKDGAATVKRIQGFARNDGDQPDAPVDMSELANDALDLTRLRWRNAAQEQGIHIELQREIQSVPMIRGHAPELREVLTNLIINAIDAMPEGGILRVATGQRGAEVFVSVADTGVGMSDEVRSRIFNPFFTTKGEKGNGLGLAVSAAIIQRHGGRIDVQSKEGRGTNFVIWLPILEIDFDEVAAHDSDVPNIQGRILVVEDEELVRVALSRMLSAWGHTVTAAEDGREALGHYRPGAFDLVICDLGLPDMQGWDVLRQVREREERIHTVLLTGWARQIDPAEARLRGVDLLINKPFDQLTLRRTLAHLLEGTLDMSPRVIV